VALALEVRTEFMGPHYNLMNAVLYNNGYVGIGHSRLDSLGRVHSRLNVTVIFV